MAKDVSKEIEDMEPEIKEVKEEVENEDLSGEDELSKITKEKDDLNDKYVRLAADFQNYKRRVENEKREIFSYANEKIINDTLNVVDNFERAIGSIDELENEKLIEGISMIYKQLMDVLKNSGVEEIETQDKEFDPKFHHAVLTEAKHDVESQHILEVLQKGYTLKGKVIRPSMVKVAE